MKKQKHKYASLTLLLFNLHKDLVKVFINSLDKKSLSKISFDKDDYEQELLIRLYKSIQYYIKQTVKGKTTGIKNIRGYCFWSMKQHSITILNRVRKASKRAVIDIEKVSDDIEYSNKIREDLLDCDFDDLKIDGINVLANLNDKERKVFKLKLFGFSEKEIQYYMKLNENAVKKLYRLAKRNVKKVYYKNLFKHLKTKNS